MFRAPSSVLSSTFVLLLLSPLLRTSQSHQTKHVEREEAKETDASQRNVIKTNILPQEKPISTDNCRIPCINGYCQEGFCFCYTGYGGDACDVKLEKCSYTPMIPAHSYLHSDLYTGKITCKDGYHIKEGVNQYVVTCKNNKWYNNKTPENLSPKCIPICIPECKNGGYCIQPHKCWCPKGYRGKSCEKEYCAKEPISLHTVLQGESGNKLCKEGYTLARKSLKVTIRCKGKKWYYEFENLMCDPVCSPPCENNGKCVAPNKCWCAPDFKGKTCSKTHCQDKPPDYFNANVQPKTPSSAILTCKNGYELANGKKSVTLNCKLGKWIMSGFSSYLNDPRYICQPICSNPCVNGGRCVAPNLCNCPEGFTGEFCEMRYNLAVGGEKCVFPFVHRGQVYITCTGVDHIKPWCATKTDDEGNILAWELCYADIGWSRNTETKIGIPCRLPFTEGGWTFYSTVFSTTVSRTCPVMPTRTDIHNVEKRDLAYSLPEFVSNAFEEVVILSDGTECKASSHKASRGETYSFCVQGNGHKFSFCDDKRKSSSKKIFCLMDYGGGKHSAHCIHNRACRKLSKEMAKFELNDCLSIYKSEKSSNESEPQEPEQGMYDMSFKCPPYHYDDRKMSPLQLVKTWYHKYEDPKVLTVVETNSAQGRRCIFPFVFKGKTYYVCATTNDNGVPWCATKVNSDREPLESELCLPDVGHYLQEINSIRRLHRGMKSEESFKNVLQEVKILNYFTFHKYTEKMGWLRFVLLLMGGHILDSYPHETESLEYVKTDSVLNDIISAKNIPTEWELKEKGIAGILELFGGEAEESKMKSIELLFIKKDLHIDDHFLGSYASALMDFDFNQVVRNDLFDEAFYFDSKQPNSLEPSNLGYSMPTSTSGQLCLPFIYEGLWYGYGGVVKRGGESSFFECAVVTNHKFEPVVFEESKIQKENEGFWMELIPNPKTHMELKIELTVKGELCLFPFKVDVTVHEECIMKKGSPNGQCPVSIDSDYFPLEFQDCKPNAETYAPIIYKTFDESASLKFKKIYSDSKIYSSPIPRLTTPTTPPPVTTTTLSPLGNFTSEGSTNEGKACIFPFSYKGLTYKECIMEDSDAFWCPTQVNEESVPMYGGYCQDRGLPPHKVVFTEDGHKCIFQENEGLQWCDIIGPFHRYWCRINRGTKDEPVIATGECRKKGEEIVPLKKKKHCSGCECVDDGYVKLKMPGVNKPCANKSHTQD